MFTRQKILLRLVDRIGGQTTRLHLVKLAFLLSSKIPTKVRFYQFVPYKYGPFSFNLYHELDLLINLGLLSCDITDNNTFRLTHQYKDQPDTLDRDLDFSITNLVTQYSKYSLSELIDDVYNRFPWYTLNSDQPTRRKASLPITSPAIYTVGYEGWQIDGFLNHLLEKGIRRLIDTRSNPVSRSYGFHKSTLGRFCKNVGLDYIHLPELGIPPSLRTELQTYADYLILFSAYESRLAEMELQKVSALINDKPSVLMCVEADPKFCHRGRLATKLNLTNDLAVVNL
jgi:uncharacterized protein (DUF488 family)